MAAESQYKRNAVTELRKALLSKLIWILTIEKVHDAWFIHTLYVNVLSHFS